MASVCIKLSLRGNGITNRPTKSYTKFDMLNLMGYQTNLLIYRLITVVGANMLVKTGWCKYTGAKYREVNSNREFS
jgi:hypothetical protein